MVHVHLDSLAAKCTNDARAGCEGETEERPKPQAAGQYSFTGASPLRPLTASRNWLATRYWQSAEIDPEMLRYGAWISVWVRWFVCVACLIELAYRPTDFPQASYMAFLLLFLLVIAINGYIHYRLMSDRTMTRNLMVALCAMDVALITAAAAATGGFTHFFQYLMYYPSLAQFAVVFSSFKLNAVWVTMVAGVYTVMSVTVGEGLDLEARDDKTLFARIFIMYAVVVMVNLVSRFALRRWQAAMEREKALQRERIDLSQTIHDTAVQTVYVIGLGVHRATNLADESNEELRATLDATADLSKSAIWELRRPLDAGYFYEGRSVGRVLRSHAATFTTVTSVPAEMVQRGVEPPLTTEVRNRLFSIAHNALTNTFRHARAGRVEVELDFGVDSIQLSVSDDGVGLPDEYAQRGHGFAGMRTDTEAMGGRLIVETLGRRGGTTVICTIPYEQAAEGDHDASW